MSRSPPPEWLEGFEARFGAVIRTPLDRASGTLRATPDAYDTELGRDTGNPEGLAVYNRQYWFRLFSVVQAVYPLFTRLTGPWKLNELAAGFLLAHPPKHWDLDAAPVGFDAFLAATLEPEGVDAEGRLLPRAMLTEALAIDAAWQRVFRAPRPDAYHPTEEDAERLPGARLIPSPTMAIVEEHWPLLALRLALVRGADKVATLGVPHPCARWWAILRRNGAMSVQALEEREATLLGLLRTETVGTALARLEQDCPEAERATLPARTRRWLSRSVILGFWTGQV